MKPFKLQNSNTGFIRNYLLMLLLALSLPTIIVPSETALAVDDFNAKLYLKLYSDLARAFGPDNFQAAKDHWINLGIKEGRRSSFVFDVKFYLERYSDLKAAFGDDYRRALDHWLIHGIKEGRRGSLEFHSKFYLEDNPDVANAYGASNYQGAIDHWLTFGIREGRAGSDDVHPGFYLNSQPGLISEIGSNNYEGGLKHWIIEGSRKKIPAKVRLTKYVGSYALAATSPSFPCNNVLESMSSLKRPAFSVVWNWAGEDKSCLKKFINKFQNRPHLIEIHLHNAWCHQSPSKCQTGVDWFADKDQNGFNNLIKNRDKKLQKKIRKTVKEILSWKRQNAVPGMTTVLLTSGLEDNYDSNAASVMTSMIKEAGWKKKRLVRNPREPKTKSRAGAGILELHPSYDKQGKSRTSKLLPSDFKLPQKEIWQCITSQDGNTFDAKSSKKAYDNIGRKGRIDDLNTTVNYLGRHCNICVASFIWTASTQGYNNGGNKKSIRKRELIFDQDDLSDVSKLFKSERLRARCPQSVG